MQRTLLIVDDIRTNREILKKILGDEYRVLEAADGQQALEAIRRSSGKISAVLLDLSMPVMDGFEVLTRVRADARLNSLPIVVTTGQTEEVSEVKALQLGANDYISKPYNPTIIKQRIRNVIHLRETSAAVNELQRDRLTGLYSRSAFFEKAGKRIAEKPAGYYVISCFDVDNFKFINDQYGADTGDKVLRFIAQVFKAGVGPMEGICSRIMADKFAVLYPKAFMDSEQLAKVRRDAATLGGSIQPITFSIGRYVVDDLSLPVSAMYDRAVLAEMSVKGRYDETIARFDESMRDSLLAEQRIVTEMDRALKSGQFEPWFQPQYNHATGKLIGAEALVRWRHPERGLMPPSQFIPIFEKNGFIYELDQYIWEQVCRCLRRWMDEGRDPLPVSVNISRCDVFRGDLCTVISGLIRQYGIPAELLRLEITESAFSKNSAQIISVVKEFIGMGFTVEIDDFGSGYSSLNTLKDVPAQILKLDMQFLEYGDDSRRCGNILESVVRMAKWLDMSVIAEGVETLQQADFLKSIGCFYVQGYLYAKPMPLGEYEALEAAGGKQRKLASLETVEHLNNNAFWNPESMDTLIFNSYLGGACIYEYCGGKLELLRANDKYAEVLTGAGMAPEDMLKLDWSEHMEEASRKEIAAALKRTAKTGEESTHELAFLNLPGCAEKTYLRTTMRVIATAGVRLLVYCTVENMTAQRQAEEKRKETTEQLRFLESVAHELLAQPDTDVGIHSILQRLLELFDGDCAAVYEFDFGKNLLRSTCEEYAKGGCAGSESCRSIPLSRVSFLFETFAQRDYVDIPNADALDGAQPQKTLLREQGVSSLMAAPVRRDGSLIGLLCVKGPRRKREEIERLSALGDYVAVLLTRRDLNTEISSENQEKLAVMDGIPGGFVRMQVRPDGLSVPLYLSEGFQKLIGMNTDELMEIYGADVMAGVHPDDLETVRGAIAAMLQQGEAHNVRYRLLRGGGGYLWVTIFGKMHKNLAGERYLNVYYADATEQVEREDAQTELLDNLPCGAALYGLSGDGLSAIHLNKHYWELVGRSPQKCEKITVLDAVYPDDRHIIREEIAAALSEQRNPSCNVRILCGDGHYQAFHVVGRIMTEANGRTIVCAAYLPASDEPPALQKLLPVILSTIMESTSDLAFVKDRNLKCVCCSDSFVRLTGRACAQEVIGKTDFELFEKETAEKFRRDDETLLKSGDAIVDMVEDIPSTDGIPHCSSTSKYLLRDSAGAVAGLYGVGRDVTQGRDAAGWIKLLTDNMPGGIATYECAADHIKLLYFNDGLSELFGVGRAAYEKRCAKNPLSYILKDDQPKLHAQIDRILCGGAAAECTFRARTGDGRRIWINLKAGVAARRSGVVLINAILTDATEQQATMEKLRLSEEQFRLAIQHTGNVVCRLTFADRTLHLTPEAAAARGVPEKICDMPYGMLRLGLISSESELPYIAFYNEILQGGKKGSLIFECRTPAGRRSLELHYSTVFSDGVPQFAILSYADVTERQEKEMIYNKWRQSLRGKAPEDYTLFRCNLCKDTSLDTQEGKLIRFVHKDRHTLNERVAEYAKEFVCDEDRADYIALVNSGALLADYGRGTRYRTIEYREKLDGGGVRWLRLAIELVRYPNSANVEAYMMYENIDAAKRAALSMQARAETDSLTGVLNRSTFSERLNSMIRAQKRGSLCALVMLDLDNFKMLNDRFGHAAGDSALIEVGRRLRAALRADDLVGRLGGDEFIVFLTNMPDKASILHKAEAICTQMQDPAASGTQMSASIGIAVCPDDGGDFETLYRMADTALYRAKGSGKNHVVFYSDKEKP